MGRDVIVNDSDFLYAATRIEDYGDELSEIIGEYITIVERVTKSAIVDDLIVAKLQNLVGAVSEIPGLISATTQETGTLCKRFISAIDWADKYLY